ncbi:MAG TPA: DNA mismatch repair protein MutS, partial [Candidatus Manganitrophaceae bacterium]|nr:DNA mismatch repair protein MutS [Candidatus Manganitrophaceae bacterium]
MNDATPLMRQYLEIKKGHPDAILFFRVGDFYEMFFEDALIASKILQIALTSRDKNKENAVPLCGIPYHAASGYIAKLIRSGYAVAVCEQMEEPGAGKGIIRREVVRVITPGALIEPELLTEKENNYLAALKWDFASPVHLSKEIGLAYLDLSTGDFRMISSHLQWVEAESELWNIRPKEMILPSELKGREKQIGPLQSGWPIRFVGASLFFRERAEESLKGHFQIHSVASLGAEKNALTAAGALLSHAQETQKTALANIISLRPHPSGERMRLHSFAQRHLELAPLSKDRTEGTLFHILDRTVTPMGGRLLREWILRPLLSPAQIIERQDAVAFFLDDLSLRARLRSLLKKMADLERLVGRISLKAGRPHDLIALKESIGLLPEIQKQLRSSTCNVPSCPSALVDHLVSLWDNLDDVFSLIESAVAPDPPLSLKEGGFIKEGYLPRLDEFRRFQKEGRSILTEIELKEKKRTGIESLKIRYNQVFGYYIEVGETHLKKIPADYIRKQTLTRAERFTTLELREVEEKIVGAVEAIQTLEEEAFEEIRAKISLQTGRVQNMARTLSLLDLFSSLAEVAHQNNYCRPEINDLLSIRIVEGRHPVLEQMGREPFVPNDTLLQAPERRLLILTGPNMAGKSTYMRQVALIVLMAQMGSFVPAREAT